MRLDYPDETVVAREIASAFTTRDFARSGRKREAPFVGKNKIYPKSSAYLHCSSSPDEGTQLNEMDHEAIALFVTNWRRTKEILVLPEKSILRQQTS